MQNNQQIEYISANSNTIIPKLQPSLQNWVNQSFGSINPLQAATTPLISKRKSALIMAPTGSGKTLSVFLGILDSLLLLEKKSKLKKKIYVIYISPLKALNNDIHKNLEIPLQHLRDDLHSEISIGTRTGDTTPKERNFLLRNPPHILITTPESLGLLITSPKFKEHLKQIDWVICDEIHSIAGNKRGTFLSLILEHLNYLTDKQFARVGLSATINPPKTIARFLMGNRKQRILIVQIETQRIMQVAVVSPVEDFLKTPFSKIQESQLNIIEERIRNNRTTLIFANTRHMSERLFYHLEKRIKDPNMLISIHHGSLDKKLRLSVEENLKKGRVSAVFTSTSLELGIDIGTIDHVVQMGSPKSVSSLLQRIGRSGHRSDLVSKGTLIAYNRDDLIESVAIAKLAIENQIDKLFIPDKPLDVLIQILVGLTLEKKWSTKAAYNLVKKSYPYRDLTYSEFRDIVSFASNPTQNDDGWKYSHIWYDPETDLFGRRRSARVAFFQNIGTIPPTSSIQVLLEGFRSRVGNLTERFAEKLNPGDIFILSGRTLQYLRPIEDKIVVREVFGKLPTVPSWSGEGLARTREISIEISDILSSIEEKIESKTSKTDLIEWIVGRYPTGKLEATIIYDYVFAQVSISRVPKFNNLVIEKFVDHDGSENIIVLSLHGKQVNSLLGQALAGYYAKITGSNIAHTSTDNGFLLKFPFGTQFDHEGLFSHFSVDQLEESLVFGLRQTEIFKLRFRHAANRSLMVISKRGRFNSSFQDQRRLSRWLIRTMHPESIVAKEAMREIFYDTFDLTSARALISKINSHKIKLHFQPVNNFPSPMSYAILFNSYVDVVFMEDRRNLLLGLHQQVLSRLLPASENEQQSLDPKLIKKYFHEKIHIESTNDPEVITELFSRYNLNNASFLKNASKKTGIDEHDIKHLMASNREILDAGSEKWVSLNYLPYFLAYNPEIVIAEDPSQDELLQAAYELTKQISPDEGISTIAKAALEFEGPLNLKELSTITGIETGRLKRIIYKLVGNYEILKGSFLSSQEEYLLRQDRDRIFGLSNNALQRFEYLAIILGTEFGSIISLGVGPIVMASIILQLLTGSGILNIDTTTTEGKKFFQGVQKLMVFFFIIFEAIIYVVMQGLQAIPGFTYIVIFQLILGGLAIF
ncbi:MAG: ATP-dependent helicase, partial [Candidatus Heimdallarchaeota archaeon]|nr:ATP-dependent helicase [Candidatus Heimdallarchaeota archaeon]